MSILNVIKKVANWGSQADALNDNFNKISQELGKVSASSPTNKGYFLSLAKLKEDYPTPIVGMYANVAGEIYYCGTAGTWEDSGKTASETVDVNGVIKISDLLQSVSDNASAVPSSSAILSAIDAVESVYDGGTAASTYGGTKEIDCGNAQG